MSTPQTKQEFPSSSSKKHKASELYDEPHLNGHGGRKNKSSSKKSKAKPKSEVNDPPFRVKCPVAPLKPGQREDAYRGKADIWDNFQFEYAVRPASWGEIRSYRNVKLSESTFSIGHIIFVCNKPDPPPEPTDLNETEMLKYDRENFWVAKILDARADSEKIVYLLVAWFYWTDELPNGKRSYHGDAELVLSNHLDIIDATTISSMADWVFYDEKNDDIVKERPERFWRQTYDVGTKRLSEVRKHCICNCPQDPDERMFMCANETCLTWNHERCMIEDISQRVWEAYQHDETERFVKEHEVQEQKSLGARVFDPVRNVGKFFENGMERIIEGSAEVVKNEESFKEEKSSNESERQHPNTPKKRGQPKKDLQNGMTMNKTLKITLETNGPDEPITYKIQEIVGEQRVWTIAVSCLKCRTVMK